MLLPFRSWERRFSRFLKAAGSKRGRKFMPMIYDRDGRDIAAVYGVAVEESDVEIVVDINLKDGGFEFE